MATRRLTRWMQILVRCMLSLAALALLFQRCSYAIDARKRATKEPGCQWNEVPNSENAQYSARFCYLDTTTVLLRLYDAEERQLLAERMFFDLDRPIFYWEPNELGYDIVTGDALQLPPTLLDRLP